MHRSDTYKAIAQRLGNIVTAKTLFAKFEVGDWVNVVYAGHIEAYGWITKITGNKAVIASSEGNVTAPISELSLVRKGKTASARKDGGKTFFDAHTARALSDLEFVLAKARTDHEKAKRTAEAEAKKPNRHTQGGAAGMASSMYDHFSRILEKPWFSTWVKSKKPEISQPAKKAFNEIKAMRDWWGNAYKQYTA